MLYPSYSFNSNTGIFTLTGTSVFIGDGGSGWYMGPDGTGKFIIYFDGVTMGTGPDGSGTYYYSSEARTAYPSGRSSSYTTVTYSYDPTSITEYGPEGVVTSGNNDGYETISGVKYYYYRYDPAHVAINPYGKDIIIYQSKTWE